MLPAKKEEGNFGFTKEHAIMCAGLNHWIIVFTSPISPLPSDSSVTWRISPPDRRATSPKEPPTEVSFSSLLWSPNQIKYNCHKQKESKSLVTSQWNSIWMHFYLPVSVFWVKLWPHFSLDWCLVGFCPY